MTALDRRCAAQCSHIVSHCVTLRHIVPWICVSHFPVVCKLIIIQLTAKINIIRYHIFHKINLAANKYLTSDLHCYFSEVTEQIIWKY